MESSQESQKQDLLTNLNNDSIKIELQDIQKETKTSNSILDETINNNTKNLKKSILKPQCQKNLDSFQQNNNDLNLDIPSRRLSESSINVSEIQQTKQKKKNLKIIKKSKTMVNEQNQSKAKSNIQEIQNQKNSDVFLQNNNDLNLDNPITRQSETNINITENLIQQSKKQNKSVKFQKKSKSITNEQNQSNVITKTQDQEQQQYQAYDTDDESDSDSIVEVENRLRAQKTIFIRKSISCSNYDQYNKSEIIKYCFKEAGGYIIICTLVVLIYELLGQFIPHNLLFKNIRNEIFFYYIFVLFIESIFSENIRFENKRRVRIGFQILMNLTLICLMMLEIPVSEVRRYMTLFIPIIMIVNKIIGNISIFRLFYKVGMNLCFILLSILYQQVIKTNLIDIPLQYRPLLANLIIAGMKQCIVVQFMVKLQEKVTGYEDLRLFIMYMFILDQANIFKDFMRYNNNFNELVFPLLNFIVMIIYLTSQFHIFFYIIRTVVMKIWNTIFQENCGKIKWLLNEFFDLLWMNYEVFIKDIQVKQAEENLQEIEGDIEIVQYTPEQIKRMIASYYLIAYIQIFIYYALILMFGRYIPFNEHEVDFTQQNLTFEKYIIILMTWLITVRCVIEYSGKYQLKYFAMMHLNTKNVLQQFLSGLFFFTLIGLETFETEKYF